MGPEVVVSLYRPHEGKSAALAKIVEEHMPLLRKTGLVTDRPSILMQSQDGTFLEIFEWRDETCMKRAHEDPDIGGLWGRMGEVADFPTLADLPEAGGRFPHFKPLDG